MRGRRYQTNFRLSGTAARTTTLDFPAQTQLPNIGTEYVIRVDHILADGTVYDPSVQGAIAGIDYTEARLEPDVPLSNHAAIRQRLPSGPTKIYRSGQNIVNMIGTNASGFEVHEVKCFGLGQHDFLATDGTSPDFSASGGPIEFGYSRGTRAPVTVFGYSLSTVYDEMRFIVHKHSNPGCATPAVLSPAPPRLVVTKVRNPPGPRIPGPIVYDITVENVGGIVALSVMLGEFVPIHTRVPPATITQGWMCTQFPGSVNLSTGGGSFCTFTVGTVLPGQAVTVPFPS